jgi:hypothetical protein
MYYAGEYVFSHALIVSKVFGCPRLVAQYICNAGCAVQANSRVRCWSSHVFLKSSSACHICHAACDCKHEGGGGQLMLKVLVTFQQFEPVADTSEAPLLDLFG